MKIYLIGILLCTSTVSLAQWGTIFEVNDDAYLYYSMQAIDFADEQNGIIVADLTEFAAPSVGITRIYYTHDGGTSWDSTDLDNHYSILSLNYVSTNIVYLEGRRTIYPTTGSPYWESGIFRSHDGGETWVFNDCTLDIPVVGVEAQPMQFINDSTGMYCNADGAYLTTDYGLSWVLVDNGYYRLPIATDGEFTYFSLYDVITYNPFTTERIQITVDGHCQGNAFRAGSNGEESIRYQLAQNGMSVNGYSVQNFAAFTIIGQNKVLHLLDNVPCHDLEMTDNNIFYSDGRIMRSEDLGSSFYFQESSDVGGFANTQCSAFSFPSDSVGYMLTINSLTNKWKVQKTTNSGGITSNYVGNIIEVTASLDEFENFELEVYPNPVSNNLSIRSTEIINEIILHDNAGREIERRVPNQLETEIHFSELSDGSYVLIVRTEKGNATRKIVKR